MFPLLAVLAILPQQVDIPAPPRGFGTAAADVVVDAAGVLSRGTIDAINRIAFDVKAKTSGEIAVAILPDLRGRDDADVALRIGREWGVGANAGVGDRARNAGVVVLVVPKETASDGRGRVRIETGRGVEGFITDGDAGDIQRAAMPYFQRADYDRAVLLIVASLADRFATEFGVTLDPTGAPAAVPLGERPGGGNAVSFPPEVVLFLLFVAVMILSGAGRVRGRGGNGCLTLLWILSSVSHGRRHGHWRGGGFGGGSFGGSGGFGGFGGGGGFSGGGSSGSW